MTNWLLGFYVGSLITVLLGINISLSAISKSLDSIAENLAKTKSNLDKDGETK